MTKHIKTLCAIALLLASPMIAQEEDAVYELSPFSVDTSGDIGYAARKSRRFVFPPSGRSP